MGRCMIDCPYRGRIFGSQCFCRHPQNTNGKSSVLIDIGKCDTCPLIGMVTPTKSLPVVNKVCAHQGELVRLGACNTCGGRGTVPVFSCSARTENECVRSSNERQRLLMPQEEALGKLDACERCSLYWISELEQTRIISRIPIDYRFSRISIISDDFQKAISELSDDILYYIVVEDNLEFKNSRWVSDTVLMLAHFDKVQCFEQIKIGGDLVSGYGARSYIGNEDGYTGGAWGYKKNPQGESVGYIKGVAIKCPE